MLFSTTEFMGICYSSNARLARPVTLHCGLIEVWGPLTLGAHPKKSLPELPILQRDILCNRYDDVQEHSPQSPACEAIQEQVKPRPHLCIVSEVTASSEGYSASRPSHGVPYGTRIWIKVPDPQCVISQDKQK